MRIRQARKRKLIRAGMLLVILTAMMLHLAACQNRRVSSEGVYHVVKRGQTLYRIALTYDVPLETITRANRIKNASQIQVGQRIFIPGARRTLKVPVVAPGEPGRASGQREGASGPDPQARPPGRITLRIAWPLRGRTVSEFGLREGVPHQGIDIAAAEGTPIQAAAAGRVIYSGIMRGYGNVVILKHEENITTVYAHNRRNYVQLNESVRQGQAIAEVGSTGRAEGPHLHFEIRVNGDPYNPRHFLP